jgi:hypothetical protein
VAWAGLCPSMVARPRPEGTSHSLWVPSVDEVIRWRPSRVTAAE